MAQYIDKSALVAEIERRIKERDFQMKSGCWVSSTYMYEDLLDFINTLEVKDVDLEEKACDAYCKVCGHYAHTTPNHICRQACDYYKNFVNYLKGK